jgi:hypothetical protein
VNPAIATAAELPNALGAEAKARLRLRQLDQIMGHAAIASALATLFAALIAAFFGHILGIASVQLWFAFKAASAAPRIAVAVGYKQDGVREMVRSRPWVLYSTIAVDGVIWGIAGLAVIHAPVDAASALVACLAVVATVATLGLQVQLRATALFATPILVITIVGLLLRFDSFGLFASVGLSLLIVQLCVSAFAAEKRLAREFLSLEQFVPGAGDAARNGRTARTNKRAVASRSRGEIHVPRDHESRAANTPARHPWHHRHAQTRTDDARLAFAAGDRAGAGGASARSYRRVARCRAHRERTA